MITTTFSQYLNRLVNQIDTEQGGLVRRLRVFQSDWLPPGTFYPNDDKGLELRPSSAARKLHDDGTDSVYLPFTLKSPETLEKILADAEIVAKWQAGVCSYTRLILPILDSIDAQFTRYAETINQSHSKLLHANVQHIGVAYKAIKYELNEAVQKFSVCRDEFLVSLKVDEDRTTAKEALRFLYGKIEDWYARMEELSRFCRAESGNIHFADLLAPKMQTLIESLGVRITQWEENGSFLVKLENVGNNRLELAEALFTMPETEVRTSKSTGQKGNNFEGSDENDVNSPTSANAAAGASAFPQTPTRQPSMPDWGEEDPRKWVDMVKINRILTPYPVRVQNLRRKIADEIERANFHPEPSFICFSFARNILRNDNANEDADDNGQSHATDENDAEYDNTDENAMDTRPAAARRPPSDENDENDDNTTMTATAKPAQRGSKNNRSGQEGSSKSSSKSSDVLRSCMSTSFKIKLLP